MVNYINWRNLRNYQYKCLVFKGQNDKKHEKRNNISPKNGIIGASRKLERQHEFLQSQRNRA